MKKTINVLLLSGIAFSLISCNSGSSVKFDSVIDSLKENNGTVTLEAKIQYTDGTTKTAYVYNRFTKNATLVDYDADIEALGPDYVDYGYVNVDGGVARYTVDSGDNLVFGGWVLAGEGSSVVDYTRSVNLVGNATWEALTKDEVEATNYTHSTINVGPIKLIGSLLGNPWIGSYCTRSITYARVEKVNKVVSMTLLSDFSYTNPMDGKNYDGSFEYVISDIGTTKITSADNYLATNPTFTALTDWPSEVKEAMTQLSGGVLPFVTLSKYANVSVSKTALGDYTEYEIEDYGIGDVEATAIAAVESLGFELSTQRGGTVTGANGSYTVKVFEKVLEDATPKTSKKVRQIQCNYVSNDYLSFEHGSGVMQIIGSVYTYPFDGETEIVKSSASGVNLYLSDLKDIDGETVFPTLNFGDYGDVIYMEDYTAKSPTSCFALKLYIPIESNDDMLAIRELIFNQLIGYKTWVVEEDYQLYWGSGDLYYDDSYITIDSGTKDLDGDGTAEDVCLIDIWFGLNS